MAGSTERLAGDDRHLGMFERVGGQGHVICESVADQGRQVGEAVEGTEGFDAVDPRDVVEHGVHGAPAPVERVLHLHDRLEGAGDSVYVVLPNGRLKVGRRSLDNHPGLENRMNDELVIGLRPNDLEAASIAGPNPERSLTATVEVTEMLGADTYIHFTVDRAPVVTPDIEELLADTGRNASDLGDKTNFIARVSPDVRVQQGDRLDLVVNTDKLHFFDPSTGDRIGVKKQAASAV